MICIDRLSCLRSECLSVILEEVLEILRCPTTGTDLRLDHGALVSCDPTEHRYEVRMGIPVLFPGGGTAGASPIVESFKTRGATYYSDNYIPGRNPERFSRLQRATRLLEHVVHPGTSVLEAGAGPAVLAEPIRRLTDSYVALDLSLENLLFARQRIGEFTGIVGTLTALPLKSEIFDVVVAVGCLEYVREWKVALGELCRVAKPGGRVIVTFANQHSPRRQWDELLIHRLSRLKGRVVGDRRPTYRRHLVAVEEVDEAFAHLDARVALLEYLNPGILGYPLSAVRRLAGWEERIARRSRHVERLASEFLILATREKVVSLESS